MKRNILNYFLWLILLTLCGCASLNPWTSLKSEEYKDGARKFEATIPEGWKRFNQVRYFLMTKDGIVLDRIIVDRQKINTKLEYTKKQFTKEMMPQDLADVEIDNFKADQTIGRFSLLNNIPVKIAGRDAFQIEYTYRVVKGGLRIRGIQYGFPYEDWIYRIRYEAADQHYFQKCKDDFEHFLKSFHII